MISVIIALALSTQATIIESPSRQSSGTGKASAGLRKNTIDIILTKAPRRSINPDRPAVLGIDQINSVSEIRRIFAKTADGVSRVPRRTMVGRIAIPAPAGCRVVSDYPMGFERRSDDVLNGRTTNLDCGSYFVSIDRWNVSVPLKVETAFGFRKLEQSAMLNNGALSRTFSIGPDNCKLTTYEWVGKSSFISVGFFTESESFSKIISVGDPLINALTR